MKKKLVIFLVSFLLLFPIAIIVYVTWKDVQKYDVDEYFTVQEKSFGEAREVMVSDIEESVQLKGTITSIDYDFYYT